MLIVFLLHLFIQSIHGLGLVTKMLTRSIEVVKPTRITVGVPTTITLIGTHLTSNDIVGIGSDKTCTSFLSTTQSKLSASNTASISIPAEKIGGVTGAVNANLNNPVLGYVCLQVDGTTIVPNHPFLDTGATIYVDMNPTINLISALRATPSHWFVASGAALTLTLGIEGFGLLPDVSTRLSSTDSCGFDSINDYAASSILVNVSNDKTYATTEFTIPHAELAVVRNSLTGIALASDLTQTQWLKNLFNTKYDNKVSQNSTGWTFCYNSGNWMAPTGPVDRRRRQLTEKQHSFPVVGAAQNGACQCQAAWEYKSKQYVGCARSFDWDQPWCYLVDSNCPGALVSLNGRETRYWIECDSTDGNPTGIQSIKQASLSGMLMMNGENGGLSLFVQNGNNIQTDLQLTLQYDSKLIP